MTPDVADAFMERAHPRQCEAIRQAQSYALLYWGRPELRLSRFEVIAAAIVATELAVLTEMFPDLPPPS